MAKIVAQEQKDLPTLPDDTILFLLVDSTKIEEKDGRNGKWEKIEFKFKIVGVQAVGGGGDPSAYDALITEHIWGSIPFRLTDHPENKLKLWSEAILGIPIGEGFELDTDFYNGRQVRGIVSTFEKTRSGINPATGQPFVGHQISALLPAAGTAPQAAPVQQGYSFNTPPVPQAQQAQQPQAAQPTLDPWATQPQQQAAADPWGTPAPGQQFSEEPPF